MPKINYRNISIGRPVLTPAQQAAQKLKAAAQIRFRELMSVDGVFEGGGALGTAYLGGLRALHDNGVWFKRVAGNSAGAITAAMIAVGFTAPEIQWLSSGFSNPPPLNPDTLSSVGITSPISFASFLDLPNINSISQPNKRKTLLWKALKGTILDEIGKTRIPIPTQSEAVNACLTEIMRSQAYRRCN